MAAEFHMTDDDTVSPDASHLEDLIELSLLTAEDKAPGPVDYPVKDHRLPELELDGP
ncbi:UNVERIFIED_ORG: hypothetical protein J2X79_003742 [Arthrobacter globiformis]|nr:hypothetical protein [Arthrobacter globiformis]